MKKRLLLLILFLLLAAQASAVCCGYAPSKLKWCCGSGSGFLGGCNIACCNCSPGCMSPRECHGPPCGFTKKIKVEYMDEKCLISSNCTKSKKDKK